LTPDGGTDLGADGAAGQALGAGGQWGLAGLQLLSWGSFYYAFAALAVPMETDLGWSRGEIMAAMSIGLVASALLSPAIGSLIDHGRGRVVMAAGSALGSLMLLLWSVSTDRWTFYGAWIGLGVAQAMTLYDAGFAVLTRRLGDATPPALMRMTLLGGFAGTVFIPAAALLSGEFGWRGALLVLAALNLLVSTPMHAWLLRGDRGASVAHHERTALHATALAMARVPAFWRLVVTFAAWSIAFGALTFHLMPLLAERGVAPQVTVLMFAAIGPLQIAGRFGLLLVPSAAAPHRLGRFLTAVLVAALLVLLLAGGNILLLALFVALYGIISGMMTILRGVAIAAFLGRAGFGAKSGLISTISGLALACAPFAAGALWDRGGYALVVTLLLGIATAGAAAFWSIPRAVAT
jgi:predicted MFS family arabinose efflux permease